MLIFQGKLSENCIKICNKRLNLTALFISSIFLILGIAVSITLMILKVPEYLEILILTIILFFVTIFFMFSKPSPLFKYDHKISINLNENKIIQSYLGNNLSKPKIRSINKIKKIIDYGNWYLICFKFDTSDFIPCIKKDIIMGTLDDFESIFKDKIVKSKKAFKD